MRIARTNTDRASARLSGWRLGLAWLGWVAVLLLSLALLAYMMPANYQVTRSEWAMETARPVAERFMSYDTYVGIIATLESLAAALAVGIGLLTAALRRNDRMGLLASAVLLAMGPFLISGNVDVWRFPAWLNLPAYLPSVLIAVFLLGIVALVYLFPDAHLPFPWSGWLLAPAGAFLLLYLLRGPLGIVDTWLAEAGWIIGFILLFTTLLGGLVAQAYRFRRLAPAARQQIKWVLLGLSAPVVLMLAMLAVQGLGVDVAWIQFFGWLQIIAWALIPITIGISMLRYHLWDVDVVIRRTLIYGVLSGTLLVAYLFGGLALQSLFRALTRQESPLAIVISTLAIAALFTPLRRRIQDVIDRRFFRKKYDAQQVLARFAQTARNETDLDALIAELARVVQETTQPESVHFWLRQDYTLHAENEAKAHETA